MQLLISDANILIDMEEGELLPQMFQLPYNFSIPDILFYEELEQEHNHLIELGLRLDELEGELVSYSVALVEQYRKPSRNVLRLRWRNIISAHFLLETKIYEPQQKMKLLLSWAQCGS